MISDVLLIVISIVLPILVVIDIIFGILAIVSKDNDMKYLEIVFIITLTGLCLSVLGIMLK